MESDETESVFVDKTLAHAEGFTSVFRRFVQSKRFLAELDLDVRGRIVEFGAQSVEIQGDLERMHGASRDIDLELG